MDRPRDDADHDQALLGAWQHGDERGFTGLVERYLPLIYARCRRALGAGDADDATQAVLLVLARKRRQAAACPVLAAWLLTVADHVIRNARRDLARRRRAEAALPMPPTPDEADVRDIKDHLDEALADLPAAERTAIQLHLLAGHTLAEVAALVGAPLRTVHARVQRGLERLRAALARRGLAVGTLALVAVLEAEAAIAVPSTVASRLHDLAPAGGEGGAISAVSARAQRWSHRGPSSMLPSIAIGSSLLLAIAATALTLPPAAEARNPGTASLAGADQRAPAATPPSTSPPPPVPAGDPADTRWWWVMKLTDGARTAERLQRIPEWALVPVEWQRTLLDGVASVRNATVAFDQLSVMPAHERAAFVQRRDGATPAATAPGTASTVVARQNGLFAAPRLPSMRGWLDATSDQAPALLALHGWLAQGSIAGMPVASVADGWVVQAQENHAHVRRRGPRLEWSADSDLAERLGDVPPACLRMGDPLADLDLRVMDDGGMGGEHLHENLAVTVQVADDGLRLVVRSRAPRQGGTQPPVMAAVPMPGADRSVFSRMPRDAMLGAVLALTPASSARSTLLTALRGTGSGTVPAAVHAQAQNSVAIELTPSGFMTSTLFQDEEVRRAMGHLIDAISSIDGQVRCWVQPGMPIPTLSLVVEMPEATARSFLAGIGTPDEEGSVAVDGMTLGWRDGTLIGTTRPDGIVGVVESGGFGDHADVQRALAAMTPAPAGFRVVLRPAALVAHAMPFAAILLPAEHQQHVAAYHRRLGETDAIGFLTATSGGGGMQWDARGLLALLVGPLLGNLLAEPEMLLQAIN